MRSAPDLTAKARIRDAAIGRFPLDGFAGTTVRAIASDAGTSPALVLHHFGSKESLRLACDEHVMAHTHELKMKAIAHREHADPIAMSAAYRLAPPLLRYLAWTVSENADAATRIFDEMLEEVSVQLDAAVAAGLMRDVGDRRAVVAVLLTMQLGGLVLHEQLSRTLGFDVLTTEGLLEVGKISLLVFSGALFERATIDQARTALDQAHGTTGPEQETLR